MRLPQSTGKNTKTRAVQTRLPLPLHKRLFDAHAGYSTRARAELQRRKTAEMQSPVDRASRMASDTWMAAALVAISTSESKTLNSAHNERCPGMRSKFPDTV